MKRGRTANKEMDGLINIGASFSAGFGTTYGRGYVLDLHLSTLTKITEETKKNIEIDSVRMIKKLLPTYFPGRELNILKDGTIYKLCGDLSLGTL